MRLFKRQAEKVGMRPGSIVFMGEQKEEKAQLNLMDYNEDNFEFRDIETVEEILPCIKKDSISWVNIYGLHEVDILKKIQEVFNIHPLVIEDILNTTQRPKIEVYDDYIFIVMKMISIEGDSTELNIEQISLILHHNFIICFQERKGDIFNPLRERIRNKRGRIHKSGSDYLAYAILDILVDYYFLVLEQIGDQLEDLDEEVAENHDLEMGQRINKLKRTLILLRKNIWPLREVINSITRDEISYFKDETTPFLRDLYDHIIQVIDTTESYREINTGIMDMYMSAVSNKMNEVMKTLTIIATIFIPLSFLAGVFGMNFDSSISPFNMPELHTRYGYPIFWLISILIGVGLVVYFKRKKWL